MVSESRPNFNEKTDILIAKGVLRGGKGELRKLVLARLRSLQKLPWTIRMFFLTPDTQYAAV